MSDLAFCAKVGECTNRLLEGNLGIRRVELIEVDSLEA
jgi:hypothetical protein